MIRRKHCHVISASRNTFAARRHKLFSESLEPRRLLAAIASDQTVTGSITSPTATVDYQVTLTAGQSLVAAVGETTTSAFDPGLTILRPDGSAQISDSSELGTLLFVNSVSQAGTWTVRVFDGGSNDAGNFRLTVGVVPGAQSPNDGNGGTITSGQRKDGTIDLGDLDVYSVALNAGDSPIATAALLSGGANFQPALDIYSPAGTHLTGNSSSLGTELAFTAATSGTYYIVVTDSVNYNAGDANLGSGDYRLRFVKAPGTQAQDDADGGPISSGGRSDARIDLGDLDVYTASLSAGDSVVSSVVERNGDLPFNPRLRVYSPGGPLVSGAADSSSIGTELAFTASTTGTYYFLGERRHQLQRRRQRHGRERLHLPLRQSPRHAGTGRRRRRADHFGPAT